VKFIAIAVWVSLFFALAFFALPKYEVSERLQAGALGNIETANIARIWFSPAGELVGIGKSGSHITIHVWDGHKGARLRERTLELPNTEELPDPVYAVSSDASKVAWVSNDGVHVEDTFPLAQPVASDHPFRRRVPITSLALTGSSELATLYKDGQLELWDLNRDTISVSKLLSITEPGPLLSNGAYLAASSLLSHDVFVFDTGLGDKLSVLEYTKFPPDMLAVTLSPMARLAAGTRDKLQLEDHPIPAPGPIRALAYYDFQSGYRAFRRWVLKFRLAEPATKSPISGEDNSMPSLLVDACLNGDCVLYAGAGVSAQAGLPLWGDCVRELVKWATGNNLAPADAIEAALVDLSRGQPGAAADRMAAAFQNNKEALYGYLRLRFRLVSDLSAAHLLIKQIDFPALITTNLDNLLDRTFPYSGGAFTLPAIAKPC
jgi:hypothetical protein